MNKKLFDIPNTPEGRQLIKSLRKQLNPNKLILRGRHSNRKKLAETLILNKDPIAFSQPTNWTRPLWELHKMLRQDVPTRFSERLAVYLKETTAS